MSYLVLMFSFFALFLATRMNATQRKEYAFFQNEHESKLGIKPGFLAKFKCWNAAIGGSAPKWHWIPPVVSPTSK